eukprot:6199577-Pleurochrysis_carterae.AAC.2
MARVAGADAPRCGVGALLAGAMCGGRDGPDRAVAARAFGALEKGSPRRAGAALDLTAAPV